jgi:hypothetical protein
MDGPVLQLGPGAIGSHGLAYDSDDSDGPGDPAPAGVADRSSDSDDSDDSGYTLGDTDGEDEELKEIDEEEAELERRRHVNRVALMHSTVLGRPWFADDDETKQEGDKPLDEYGAFEANDEGAGSLCVLVRAIQEELDKEWSAYDPEYGTTYEEEQLEREQSGENSVTDVTTPLVNAHNPPPACEVCFCCKKKAACDYQTTEAVFWKGWVKTNGVFGIDCVKDMARLLLANNYVEVRRRTACCRTVGCMLAQGLLKYECYEAWVRSPTSRTQLERGTDRKDQGLAFSENIIFLRTLAVMTPCPLSAEELRALFQWVVLHSQWIQEREKRFIATAMCVANNPHLFGYTFSKKQRFVDRMGSFVRRYALNVIFPHILNVDLKWYRWKSTANCLLETGMPKAPDVVFALLCEDNWEAWGEPKDADGRYKHRVPRGNPDSAKLFTREGFEEALTRCTHGKTGKVDTKTGKEILLAVQQRLNFASEADAGSSKRNDAEKLQKKISGSHRKLYTVGHAVSAPPTCGSAQANSGVHPRYRNEGIWKALDYTNQEAKARTDMYMQDYENGNTVGHEKQSSGDKSKSKACTVIRPITAYVPPPVKQFNTTRALPQFKCMDALIPMRPTKRKF